MHCMGTKSYLCKALCYIVISQYMKKDIVKEEISYLGIYASIPVLFVRDITLHEIHPSFSNRWISLPVSIRFPVHPSLPRVPFL